jgi:uncharacterized protein (TIGR00725 family)
MKVSVFGGSQPKEDSSAYAEARELGRLLAERGHIVLTGGYIGVMEGRSHAARMKRVGMSSASPVKILKHGVPIKANSWVMEEIRTKTLVERLHTLIHESDAAFALPGGAGTLAEISVMWNLNDRGVATPEAVDTDRRRLAVCL